MTAPDTRTVFLEELARVAPDIDPGTVGDDDHIGICEDLSGVFGDLGPFPRALRAAGCDMAVCGEPVGVFFAFDDEGGFARFDGIDHRTDLCLAGRLFALFVGHQFHAAEQAFAANVANDGMIQQFTEPAEQVVAHHPAVFDQVFRLHDADIFQ